MSSNGRVAAIESSRVMGFVMGSAVFLMALAAGAVLPVLMLLAIMILLMCLPESLDWSGLLEVLLLPSLAISIALSFRGIVRVSRGNALAQPRPIRLRLGMQICLGATILALIVGIFSARMLAEGHVFGVLSGVAAFGCMVVAIMMPLRLAFAVPSPACNELES